jgi:hypothetical protein
MKRINRLLIFLIPIIILGTGFIVYFKHFEGKFSDSAPEWGSYGTYINSFVTLANVSLFIMFSLLVYNYNKLNNRPILTFKTKFKKGKKEIWRIRNIGNGAALNLLVGYKTNAKNEWISPTVKSYSFGKDDEVIIDWITGSPDIIGVHYTDIFDEAFFAVVGNDVTTLRPVSNFKTITINKEIIYDKTEVEKFLNVPSIRITRARLNSHNEDETGDNGGDATSSNTTQTTSQFG